MDEDTIKHLCKIVREIDDKKRYLDTVGGYETRYSIETASEALGEVVKQLNGLLFTATFGQSNHYPLLPRDVRSMIRYAQSR